MTSHSEKFESLARECGDAMLVVSQAIATDDYGNFEHKLVIALARLGDWAVCSPALGDIPKLASGRKSRAKLGVIVNVPSGLKVGIAMPVAQAMDVLCKLADVPAGDQATVLANRDRILAALPMEHGPSGNCNFDSARDAMPAVVIAGYAD